MAIYEYQQTDPAWANVAYAGGTIGDSGCGLLATSDLLGHKNPYDVMRFMRENGDANQGIYRYESNGSGTYAQGIAACFTQYGFNGRMLTSHSVAGCREHAAFEAFKAHIKAGMCGVLLMGGVNTGCVNSYWALNGHYISVSSYDASKDMYYIIDPVWQGHRGGWHSWDDLAGNIKHVITCTVKWGNATPSTDYTLTLPQLYPGIVGNTAVYVLECILKARNLYKGQLDFSYGPMLLEAVSEFQKANKLKVDGIVGPKTWIMLFGIQGEVNGSVTRITLKPCSKGDKNSVYVLFVQERLIACGRYVGELTRNFDEKLRKAVITYQKDRGLDPDGVPGKDTYRDMCGGL